MTAFRAVIVVAIGALVLSVVVVALFVFRPSPEPGTFTINTAIILAGYFLFPVLIVVAGALLLIAFMLLVGAAIERRRTGREAQ